jgi:biopolymer transport protein ExbD
MSEQRSKNKHRSKKNSVRDMPEEDPDFQIAPMIDVLLVLLVFFMSISSTEVLQSTKGIELPVAPDGADAKKGVKGQVIVNVSWVTLGNGEAGSITLDERVYTNPNDMLPYLLERKRANPEVRVLVRADKQTRYDFTRGIMYAVGQAGIDNVTFSVVDKEGQKVASSP